MDQIGPPWTTNSIYNYALIHCAGKFYCVAEGFKLHVIDPFLSTPSIQLLEMDTSQLFPCTILDNFIFQEFNGEIKLICKISELLQYTIA